MTVRNEALISRYFDRQMTSGEEQNFLISLAASNELRLAFRSHLELMKAIRDDKREMQPIAEVRSRTLAALGLSAAATAPFLEQALLHSNSAKAATHEAAMHESSTTGTSIQKSQPFFSRWMGKSLLAGSGLVMGFLAASLFFSAPQIHISQTTSGVKPLIQSSQPTHVLSTPPLRTEEPKMEQKSTTYRASHIVSQSANRSTLTKPDVEFKQPAVSKHESKPSGAAIQTIVGDDSTTGK